MPKKTYTFKLVDDLSKLHERATEIDVTVENERVKEIVRNLKKALEDNPELPAIAATQLGYDARIFCVKFADGDIREFINPMISKSEGLHLSRESCKGLGDAEYIIPRNDRIIAIYETANKKITSNKFEGAAAEIFQQMTNMLDGMLICDLGLEILPEFDEAPDEEKQEVIGWYLDQLKATSEDLREEIEKDPELKQMKGAVDFLTKAANGEIEIEKIKHEVPKAEEAVAEEEKKEANEA